MEEQVVARAVMGVSTAAWLLLTVFAVSAAEVHDGALGKLSAKACAARYSAACLKADAVGLLDRLSRGDELQVLPGVRLVRSDPSGAASSPAQLAAELAREHPNDVDARLDAYLARRAALFLDTHALSVKLPDPAGLLGSATDAQTGRGKGKGGKGMQLVFAAMAMMKAMLGALGIGAVALLAGKALMAGMLALMLAAIVGLKSAAGGGGKHVTYEIVSKPVVSHVDTHSHEVTHEHGHQGYGHSSYGRSFDTAPGAAAGDRPRPAHQAAAAAAAPAEPYQGAPLGGGGARRRHNTYLPLTAPGADVGAAT